MAVDIVAEGTKIPVDDKSFDFVISSHVIEHFFDPIAALKEWSRIARKYIYVICPKRDALPSDRDLPLTPLEEIYARHTGVIPPPEIDTHEHYSRWTPNTFCHMCQAFGFFVIDCLETDDKVGNGFTVILKPLD
jgi:Methylase involved in ubiquinone/menaquinone biosynthesis